MSSGSSHTRLSRTVELGPYSDADVLEPTSIRKPLDLRCVAFEQNCKIYGLDFIEDKVKRDEGDVYYHGKWIADRKLFSNSGKLRLRTDLERKGYRNAETVLNASSNVELNVKLSGKLNANPIIPKYSHKDKPLNYSFRILSTIPLPRSNGCIQYTILSLSTSQLLYHSSKFFDHYRALHLIEAAIAYDDKQTSIASRNPSWLLQTYAKMNGFPADSNSDNCEPYQRALDLLIANADWIAETMAKKREMLDKDVWRNFARNVRQGKGRTSKALGRVPTVSDRNRVIDAGDPIDFNRDTDQRTQGLNRTYRTKNISRPAKVQARHKKNKPTIPPFFIQAPEFFPDRPWICPLPGCSYAIDFRRGMTDEDLADLEPRERMWIRMHYMDVSNDDVVDTLTILVDSHKFKHLDDLGIGLFLITETEDLYGEIDVKRTRITKPKQIPIDAKVEFGWLRPANHRPAFAHLHDSESD